MTDAPAPLVNAQINTAGKMVVKHTSGSEEAIQVCLVPFRHAAKYLELLGEIAAFVEFMCGMQPGWADTLEDDSIFALDALCRELNDSRIDRFLKRQFQATEKLQSTVASVRISSDSV